VTPGTHTDHDVLLVRARLTPSLSPRGG
jgi:hypothetical protein